jgi:hypothetical protein
MNNFPDTDQYTNEELQGICKDILNISNKIAEVIKGHGFIMVFIPFINVLIERLLSQNKLANDMAVMMHYDTNAPHNKEFCDHYCDLYNSLVKERDFALALLGFKSQDEFIDNLNKLIQPKKEDKQDG